MTTETEAGSGGSLRKRALAVLVLAGMTVLPAYAIATRDGRIPSQTRGWAALLWLLCLVPLCVYVMQKKENRTPIPFFPVVGLLYGFYYALPVIAPLGSLVQGEMTINPAREYDMPVVAALIGWVALLFSYLMVGLVYRGRKRVATVDWDVSALRRAGFVLLYGGFTVDLAQKAVELPSVIGGLLTFTVMLGWLGASILIILAVQHHLSRVQRVQLVTLVLGSIGLQLAGGAAANLVVWAAVVFLSIWIGRGYLGRGWIIAMVFAGMMIFVYRAIKPQFIQVAWYTQQLTVSEQIQLGAELVSLKIQSEGFANSAIEGLETSGRWGTLDVFAVITRSTPSRVPYWNGESFLSLVGMAVPRVLWPGKPSKKLGQEFGHRYGFLHQDDFATSINLPYLIEFYINFGLAGVLSGMLVVGAIYRVLQRLVNSPGQDPLTSVVGLVLLVPLFNIESDFSLTFGGLLMNGVAIWIVLRAIRSHTRRKDPRPGVAWMPNSSPVRV